ncbi:MAG TPA: hypothetical protein VLX29_03820 [Nitrospirota bacterium]|nr:hypothetical protein [Nitrospirota bacterium]
MNPKLKKKCTVKICIYGSSFAVLVAEHQHHAVNECGALILSEVSCDFECNGWPYQGGILPSRTTPAAFSPCFSDADIRGNTFDAPELGAVQLKLYRWSPVVARGLT